MYADRLPPHDANAEESVIGSVLIDGDSLHKVSSLIRPTDFYGEKNRWCYEAFLGLAERGEAINQVTVAHELSLQERLESLGGSAYLSHLVMVVPTSVHIEYYAGIVQRTSVMRQLIDAGGRIADIGYHESDSDTDLALSKAENTLFHIRSRRGSGAFLHIRNVLDTYMETNVAFTPATVGLSPVQTGFQSHRRAAWKRDAAVGHDSSGSEAKPGQEHACVQHRSRGGRERQSCGHIQP